MMEADDVMARIGSVLGDYIKADGIAIIAVQGTQGVATWSGCIDGSDRAAMMRRLIDRLRTLANLLEEELGPGVIS